MSRRPSVRVELNLPPLLVEQIDRSKGEEVARATWIKNAIRMRLASDAQKTPEAVPSPGSGASAQSRVVAPPSGAAPPVAPDSQMADSMECPNAPDHPLGWNDRRGYVCAVCVNTKAVPR